NVESVVARLRLANVLDRLGHGGGFVDGDDVRRHQAAGSALAVLEELLNLFGLLLGHEVEDLFRLFLGKLLHDLDDVVGRHLVEHARDFLLVEGAQQLALGGIVELREDFARVLGRQQPKEAHLIGEGELAQDRGDVGGVRVLEEAGQALVASATEQLLDRLGQALGLAHALVRPRAPRSARRNRALMVAATSPAGQSRWRITALAMARWPPARPRSAKAWRTTSPAARSWPELRTEMWSSPSISPETTVHSAPSTCSSRSAN